MKTILFLIMGFFFLIPLTSQEQVALQKSYFFRLAQSVEVDIVDILPGGDIIALATPPGKEALLMWRNVFTNESGKVTLPFSSVDYISAGATNGQVTFFQVASGELWNLDRASGEISMWQKKEKGKSGFALHPSPQSRFLYAGNSLYAWGYLYNNAGKNADYIVEMNLNLERKKIRTNKLLSYSKLTKSAKRHHPKIKQIAKMQIQSNYLALATQDEKGEGVLLAVDLVDGGSFPIAPFRQMVGSALASGNNLFAYVTIPLGEQKEKIGELYLYDLKKRAAQTIVEDKKVLKGRFIRPVFNAAGDHLAIGKVEKKGSQVFQDILIIDLKTHTQESITVTHKVPYISWHFVQNDKNEPYLLLFDGETFFQKKL